MGPTFIRRRWEVAEWRWWFGGGVGRVQSTPSIIHRRSHARHGPRSGIATCRAYRWRTAEDEEAGVEGRRGRWKEASSTTTTTTTSSSCADEDFNLIRLPLARLPENEPVRLWTDRY